MYWECGAQSASEVCQQWTRTISSLIRAHFGCTSGKMATNLLWNPLLCYVKTLMPSNRRDFFNLHHGNKPTQRCGHHFSKVMTQTVVQPHSVHFSHSMKKGGVNLTMHQQIFFSQRLKERHRVPLWNWMWGRRTLFWHGYWCLQSECTDLLGEVIHAKSHLNISPQL